MPTKSQGEMLLALVPADLADYLYTIRADHAPERWDQIVLAMVHWHFSQNAETLAVQRYFSMSGGSELNSLDQAATTARDVLEQGIYDDVWLAASLEGIRLSCYARLFAKMVYADTGHLSNMGSFAGEMVTVSTTFNTAVEFLFAVFDEPPVNMTVPPFGALNAINDVARACIADVSLRGYHLSGWQAVWKQIVQAAAFLIVMPVPPYTPREVAALWDTTYADLERSLGLTPGPANPRTMLSKELARWVE